LQEKFGRIQDLRKKISELEKFKFVLDFKIKELNTQIGPKEIEIKRLKDQVNKMNSEFKHFTRVNANLALIVEDLRLRQLGLINEVEKLKNELRSQDDEKCKFQVDLQEMLLTSTNDKKLKVGIIGLHKRWVLLEDKETNRLEKGSIEEHKAN